jgi:hypothetical protein
MKRLLGIGLALLLTGQAAPRTQVSDLAWMGGHWTTEEGGIWTEEHWSAPRAGTMIGYSRSGRGATTREYEYLRLEAGVDGVPAYVASPGGGPAISFPLARSDAASATFENPAHDFPQRIVYRRNGSEMVATISAIDGSHAMSWRYRRR